MRKLLLVLAVSCLAMPVLAQDVLLDYDTAYTPDQQGFELQDSCSDAWGSIDGILEYYGCPGSNHSYATDTDLLDGVSSVQLDITMRILDSDGFAFELVLWQSGSAGRYTKIAASDFGDTDWHEITIFMDFEENTYSSFLDGEDYSFHNFAWNTSGAGFIMGDGNSSGTWGRIDISSLTITGNFAEPVGNQQMTWGSVKGLFQ